MRRKHVLTKCWTRQLVELQWITNDRTRTSLNYLAIAADDAAERRKRARKLFARRLVGRFRSLRRDAVASSRQSHFLQTHPTLIWCCSPSLCSSWVVYYIAVYLRFIYRQCSNFHDTGAYSTYEHVYSPEGRTDRGVLPRCCVLPGSSTIWLCNLVSFPV